ncbi:metal-dependent hydrolase [Duganella sp. LX20W]|uniref:Metal-dependent hydrolase n=1 Tax=Rugamonas brunnea TaxID=2758569 RepID=A0A7W2EUS4_9BURK|nr:metal-dependent hydrolase [Rugamonas brunnea]MBA5639003.1 metal-dependent hydrolase [Rugamonas brunnea]
MDNITHTVVGLGVGELLERSLPPEADTRLARTRRRLLLTACALASNFPDLDILLSGRLPDPLGYLLNHRGHTHTLLYALPQALALAALLWLCWPAARALLRASRPARWGLAGSIAAGLGLHLLLDYTNSYGLHPFYPFDGRWFYGDMVFIVEPLYWIAFGAPLAMMLATRRARVAALAVPVAALLFFTAQGYLGAASCAALLGTGLLLGMVQHRAGAQGRAALLLALGLCGVYVAGQGVASHVGGQRIRAALQHIDPAGRVLDVAMTAYPSQPLCWNFVSVESDEAAGRYRMRRGVASLAPGWLAPLACPRRLVDEGGRVTLAPAIVEMSEVTASLQALRQLQRDDCHVNAWLRFARAPALSMATGEASDYRFATTPRGNFTTLHFGAMRGDACPQGVPGWADPRADLLAMPAPTTPAQATLAEGRRSAPAAAR